MNGLMKPTLRGGDEWREFFQAPKLNSLSRGVVVVAVFWNPNQPLVLKVVGVSLTFLRFFGQWVFCGKFPRLLQKWPEHFLGSW